MRALAMIIALVVVSSFGMQAQPEPAIVNFGQLVLGGSIGALVGGVGGGLTAYGICRATAEGPWADLACLAGAILFGYVPGVPIGAAVGVSIVGSFQKADGNVWTALLGAGLAGAATFFVSDWALRALGDTPNAQVLRDLFIPIVFFGVIPVSAGTGAAWGYTLTARLRTE